MFLFSLLIGCSTLDPQPYIFPSKDSTKEELDKWRKEREKYVAEHPELGKNIKDLILAGVVAIGLTREQLRLVYGSDPDKIETTNLKYGADEMWFYRGHLWNDYFYFKDGVLIKIDHKREK